MFHGHLDYFHKQSLRRRPNTNPRNHGTPNTHNRWFLLLYHVWGPTWMEIRQNSIWLRTQSHVTSHYTCEPVTTRHDFGGVLGTAFGHFPLGSQNFMVTALGSCVKWPLGMLRSKSIYANLTWLNQQASCQHWWVLGEDFRQNQSRSKCFQFELGTCWYLLFFFIALCWFKTYSTKSC